MSRFTQCGNQIISRMDGETLVLEPWGTDSVRVRARMMGDVTDDRYALLDAPQTDVQITIEEKKATLVNGKMTAVIQVSTWREYAQISFYNEKGELLLKEIDNRGALALYARHFQPTIGGDFALEASFEAHEGERLYGMGQYQQAELDVKYTTLELAHRNSQASVPFILSSRGYGFFWHNPAIGEATFAKNKTVWKAQSTRQLDYFVCAGDTPADIIACYTRATGTPPMMPEYGLGFWQCKLRYWNQEQLLEVAREYHRRGLPVDVIVCDFFHWPKMGDFRFEEEFFPAPEAMVKELKSMGMELMVSVWPQIDLQSENYHEMRKEGLLIRAERGEQLSMRFGGDSIFYDATNPRAQAYVWDKCKKNYYDHGIKIFWLDEAEPEYGTYDFGNYRYHMGTNLQIGNIYPQQYAKTFYDGQQSEGQENIVNLLRCAWAGSQRYGALVWSGDIHSNWETFRRQLCAGLNMGICGIPWWTTDIGGFSDGNPDDPAFRELLVRWFQWGAFCPVMRLHGDRQPAGQPVWREDGTQSLFTGANNEVWSYGEEAYPILEKYIHLRETLRDYTRELMRGAHEDGAPLMRTMFYEFPQDAICWELKEQYMYGPDVLVAPVLYPGVSEISVYLPMGERWTLMHSGAVYEGGQHVSVSTPLDTMPVFLRGESHKDWIGRG